MANGCDKARVQTTTTAPAPAKAPDELLTIAQVCTAFARRNGRPLHPSTVYRWANKGIGGCRLRVVLIGRGMRTSMTWLREFGQEVARRRGLATGQELRA